MNLSKLIILTADILGHLLLQSLFSFLKKGDTPSSRWTRELKETGPRPYSNIFHEFSSNVEISKQTRGEWHSYCCHFEPEKRKAEDNVPKPWGGALLGHADCVFEGSVPGSCNDHRACWAESSGIQERRTLLAQTEVKFQGFQVYYHPPFEDQDKNQALPLNRNSFLTRYVHQNLPGWFKKRT